jgi:hypothetical protein
MKKSLKTGIYIAFISTTLINTSCATLFSRKTADVVLYDVPKDLEVKDNSVPVTMVEVFSSAKSRTNYENTVTKTTTYYSPGVQLDKKVKHILELSSGGKSALVQVKSKMSGTWFVLNLFTTGPLGLIIDGSTKNWRVLKPRHIDVPALLNGTKQRSAHRLKKDLRKQFKNKK